MIINIATHRDKGCGDVHDWNDDNTVEKSLKALLECDIGFNADITTLTPTAIVTETVVMGCLDRTTYTGSKEAMLPLLKIAAVAILAKAELYKQEYREVIIEKVVELSKGIPLWLDSSFALVQGGGIVRTAVTTVMAFDNPDITQRLMKLNAGDLLALYYLSVSENMTAEELLPLVA